MEQLRRKTNRFLWGSLVFVVVLCVSVFSVMGTYMGHVNEETVTNAATMYMSSVSEQISLHFETMVNTQLGHMRQAARSIASDIHGNKEQKERLCTYMQALGFQAAGFYSEDGSFDPLYGGMLSVIDPEPFRNSLLAGDPKIAVGLDGDGGKVVLMGIPAEHGRNGASCIGFVGSMSLDLINDSLPLEVDEDGVYSFIIRRDGSFVIRSAGAFRESYFDRVRTVYEDVNGNLSPEEYLFELGRAMADGRPYSGSAMIEGRHKHLYCQHLASSEWYLLTFMPYESVGGILSGLNRDWTICVVIGAAMILLSLGAVFLIYFRLSKSQMEMLKESRDRAEAATRAKSEFLSNMSHDIRTPMNAIVGMTAIATANMDDKEKVRSCLRKITLSSRQLLGLVNDVLDMSKIESGKMTLSMEQVSLREITESIVAIMQPQVNAKEQDFRVSIRDISCENVYCDSVRLNQVLMNILSNAVKFTDMGGMISMSVAEEASPKGDGYVRVVFSVRDTGCGMSEEFLGHIFESFVREDNARVHHTQGSGLGMAITKYIVDAMGGTIGVESELGVGTEFRVVLDMERSDVPEEDMVLPRHRVLVVDDDADLCESVCGSLESIGMVTDWVQDGRSAVEQVMSHAGTQQAYQVILLDWKLPDIDGVETARRIRKALYEAELEEVPILLISAYDCSEIEDKAREAGVNGFMPKPLFKSTLYRNLKQYVGGGAEAVAPVKPVEKPLSGRRVLVAEDNELNWDVAQELLSELGLELAWARDGEKCLEMFSGSEPGYYDAILMDIRMPRMNGYEATRAIRKLKREDNGLPIVAMTADAFAEDVKRALESGMDAHVAKPIDIDEVVKTLERLWDKP